MVAWAGRTAGFLALGLAAATAACAPPAGTGDPAGAPRLLVTAGAAGVGDAEADAPEPAAGGSGCVALLSAERSAEGGLRVVPEVRPIDVAAAGTLLPEAGSAARQLSDCLLLVDRVRTEDVRIVPVGSATVEAVRVTGVRRRTNPERIELERELAKAKREARDDGPGILRTGEPTVDLVGLVASALLGALGRIDGDEERIADLEDRLAATPRTIDEEVTVTVPLRVERYEVRKIGRVRVALFEPATGRAWRASPEVRETRSFALLPADAPADLRLPEAGDLVFVSDRGAIEAFAREPPRVRLPALLPAVLAALGDGPEPTTLAALEAEWKGDRGLSSGIGAASLEAIEPAAAPPAAFSPSVVVVRDADGRPGAFGVYVGPEHILTLARTLPPTTLVPVEVAPGLVTYGLVESRDDGSDLALLWVPRRGSPLPLAEAAGAAARALRPATGGEDALPGTPFATAEGLVAISRLRGDGDVVEARALRRFLLRARERDGVDLPPGSFGS